MSHILWFPEPSRSSSKNDRDKNLNKLQCLSEFSEIEFLKTGQVLISLRHKYLLSYGKNFLLNDLFWKIVAYNFEKILDSLHFKCNLKVPDFTIMSPLTSNQTEQLEIQE